MGICSSCSSTPAPATAKLILEDGRLEEFSYPVKVSYILSNYPTTFICNSDEMEFDDVVTAVHADDELQPGQLYFALPLTKLSRPLQAEEMAELAVKANAALLKTAAGGDKCRCRKKGRMGFFTREKKSRSSSAKVADIGAAATGGGGGVRRMRVENRNRNRNRIANGRGKMFMVSLSTIPE